MLKRLLAAIAILNGLALWASAAQAQLQPSQLVLWDTLRMSRTISLSPLEYPVAMLVRGNFLLVSDLRVSPHIYVIDRESRSVYARLGPHGGGGQAISSANCLQPSSRSPLHFFFADSDSGQMIEAAIDGRSNSRILSRVEIPELKPGCAFPLGEQIVVNAQFPDRLFYRVKNNVLDRDSIIGMPPAPQRVRENYAVLSLRPDGRAVALAFYRFGRIVIFPESLRDIVTTDVVPFSGATLAEAFATVTSTNTSVFAVWTGGRRGPGEQTDSSSVLYEFDWDGKFKSARLLDQPVRLAAISGDGRTLYGLFLRDRKVVLGEWVIVPPRR